LSYVTFRGQNRFIDLLMPSDMFPTGTAHDSM
jgi:hypothetical protein